MPFLWDAGNVGHIALHDISPEEAEQVLDNDPIDFPAYLRNGEERINHVGQTDAGRILVVVITWREGNIRVVTAHPADRDMRAFYAQAREAVDAGDSEDT